MGISGAVSFLVHHPITPPEILEPVRRQRRVHRRGRDRAMPQPSLDCPRVVPLVGKCIAAGMAKHVRVRFQLKAGACGCPLDQPPKASRRERAPRSLTNTKGDGRVASRCSRRRARLSSPCRGCVLTSEAPALPKLLLSKGRGCVRPCLTTSRSKPTPAASGVFRYAG
jgi:hypothetical protein